MQITKLLCKHFKQQLKICRLLAVTTILFLPLFSLGQNLVPNPSFEDTIACPNFIAQINRASGWTSFRNTPEYFNTCAPYSINGVSIPDNLVGHQAPKTGNAYAGLYSYIKGGSNFREWIGCQLLQSLIIGKKYYIKFFVSLAFKANRQISMASNKLGARLSTYAYASNNQLPLNGYAHIHSDSIIKDTLNWTEISGAFVADSIYSYLVIGNFFDDSLTLSTPLDTDALNAYYYIDDISITDSIPEQINANNKQAEIKIIPNPATDVLELEGENIESVFLYDSWGRLVNSFYSNASIIHLNTSRFQRGLYYIKINSHNISFVQKLILQ